MDDSAVDPLTTPWTNKARLMTLAEFKDTLGHDNPPDDLSEELKALWLSFRDGWEAGHVIVQDIDSSSAAWVHAHLHRIEGDLSNAAYWYRRAGRPACDASLDSEWDQIAATLLET